MVIDPDHLRHEIAMMQYMKVKVDASNLKISDKAIHLYAVPCETGCLRRSGFPRRVPHSDHAEGHRAYAYGDKYMKKTLRLGDLLELDAPSVQHRLKSYHRQQESGAGECIQSGAALL